MSNNAKKKAVLRLYDLADYGIGHPEAITFGPYRDFFDHRLVLSVISTDHAEALRLHREFVEDGLITAPQQTSRRQPDGSRRSFQVQRLSLERIIVVMGQIVDREIAVAFNAVTCANCPHDGPGDVPMLEDLVHGEAVVQHEAELAAMSEPPAA
jgi:hypothetical protein